MIDLDRIKARAVALEKDLADAKANRDRRLYELVEVQIAAHAREDVPALVAEVERLQAALHLPGTTCGWEPAAKKLQERVKELEHDLERYKAGCQAPKPCPCCKRADGIRDAANDREHRVLVMIADVRARLHGQDRGGNTYPTELAGFVEKLAAVYGVTP